MKKLPGAGSARPCFKARLYVQMLFVRVTNFESPSQPAIWACLQTPGACLKRLSPSQIGAYIMHIKFAEDEEIMMAEPPAAAVTLHQPNCHQALPHRGTYVMKVDIRNDDGVIAASTSSNNVKLYATASDGHALHLTDLSGHGGRITDMSFTKGSALHSSCVDGFIRGYDVSRTPGANPTERFQLPHHQEALSFALHDNLIVAGGQGEVVFFDRRSTAAPLSILEDTHQEDVTSVLLHPTLHHVISASTDGLVAVHKIDPSSGGAAAVANDDESFVAALNPGMSVEQCGFFGRQGEKLWIRTGNETLLLWDWFSATQAEVSEGNEASAEFDQARDNAVSAAVRGNIGSLFEEVHYLIGCTYDSASDQLSLMAGTSVGNVGLFPISEKREKAAEILPPTVAFHGSHTDIVRSLSCYGPANNRRYISGGEDGLICLWGGSKTGSQLQQGVSSISLSTHKGEKHQHQGNNAGSGPHAMPQGGSYVKLEGDGSGPSRRETTTKMNSKKFRSQNPY